MENSTIHDTKNIILFPFGKNTRGAIGTLQSNGYSIIEIWDNYSTTESYQGIHVNQPHHLDSDVMIICCGNSSIQDEIVAQAQTFCKYVIRYEQIMPVLHFSAKQKRENFLYLHELQEQEWRKAHPNGLILSSIETPITERCTLRCRDCSNLMQYFVNPKDADTRKTLQDMDRVLQAVDHIEHAAIVGGEPFINKQMYQYVDYFVTQPKVGAVFVITNGTIVPTEENLRCLKHPKVYVRISDYGAISRHVEEIIQLLEEEEIAYSVERELKWNDCASIICHNRSSVQLEEIFSCCCANQLFTLRDGRLFVCPFLANTWALKALPLSVDESIKLDDYSDTELSQAIYHFQTRKYFKGCDYCAGRDVREGDLPPAIQTSKALPYQKYE